MADRHSVIPRTLCFVFHGSRILLIKAADHKEWAGVYNPLGGHIEKGEDIVQSANREIKEESGLAVNSTALKGIIHVTNFYGKNIMVFVTRSEVDTSEVIQSDEGELVWINPENIDSLNTFADLKIIFQLVFQAKQGEIFTATSSYSDEGELLSFTTTPSLAPDQTNYE